MHRRWSLTLLRSLLLSLFVLGGPGLPLVDAVVWHGTGTHQVAGSRFDTPGATRTHADTCSLAAPLPVPGPVPCAVSLVPALLAPARVPETRSQQSRVTATPDSNARPRAPPALSA